MSCRVEARFARLRLDFPKLGLGILLGSHSRHIFQEFQYQSGHGVAGTSRTRKGAAESVREDL